MKNLRLLLLVMSYGMLQNLHAGEYVEPNTVVSNGQRGYAYPEDMPGFAGDDDDRNDDYTGFYHNDSDTDETPTYATVNKTKNIYDQVTASGGARDDDEYEEPVVRPSVSQRVAVQPKPTIPSYTVVNKNRSQSITYPLDEYDDGYPAASTSDPIYDTASAGTGNDESSSDGNDSGKASTLASPEKSSPDASPVAPPRRPSLFQRLMGLGSAAPKTAASTFTVKFDTKMLNSYKQAADILQGNSSQFMKEAQQIVSKFDLAQATKFENKYEKLVQLATTFNGLLGVSRLAEEVSTDQNFVSNFQQFGQVSIEDLRQVLPFDKDNAPWGTTSSKKTIAELSNDKLLRVLIAIRQHRLVHIPRITTIVHMIKKIEGAVFNSLIDALYADNKVCRQAVQGLVQGKTIVLDDTTKGIIKTLTTFPDGANRISPLPVAIIAKYNQVTSILYLYQIKDRIKSVLRESGKVRLTPSLVENIKESFQKEIVFLQQLSDTHQISSGQEEDWALIQQQFKGKAVQAW